MGTFLEQLKKYTEERFGPEAAAHSCIYASWLEKQNAITYDNSYGFITMNLVGDALLIYDLYIKPEFRLSNKAWELFNLAKEIANQFNKKCIITFSQKDSQNKELGISAIKAAGFINHGETSDEVIYIRGA